MRCNIAFYTLLLATSLAFTNAVPAQNQSLLRVIVRDSYLPSVPVLVRAELRHPDGTFDRSVWDAEVTLTSSVPGVTITPDRVTLRNGCGSALVLVEGGGDFTMNAEWGEAIVQKNLRDLSGDQSLTVSGVLPGDETTWSGVVRVTDDVTIPAGHSLTVAAGTLVLVDGVASGRTAPDVLVQGEIHSLGNESSPVTFTCSDANLRWGQIDHTDADPSLYRYTVISRGGRAASEGHTGQGPAIDCSNSSIRFENCTIADHAEMSPQSPAWGTPGKIMQATSGSDLVFDECLLTRSRMGPEISGTALLFRHSYIIDMRGDDDADAIYIHSQQSGQQALLEGSVIAGTDDDGMDTLGSRVTIHDSIVRDTFDKGMSLFGNEVHISHCLSANCGIGLSSKANNGATITARIWNSTIVGKDRGIAAENKGGGSPSATVLYFVTNAIIQAVSRPEWTVYTDYDPANISITYSTTVSTNWPGTGNLTADPQFVNGVSNFQLRPTSPCIDAGDPASAPDPDGTRADMGAFPSRQLPLALLSPSMEEEGIFTFGVQTSSGDVVNIQATRLFDQWEPILHATNLGDGITIGVPTDDEPQRYFRAVLENR